MAKLRKAVNQEHKTIAETKTFESHARQKHWQIIRDSKADLRPWLKLNLTMGKS